MSNTNPTTYMNLPNPVPGGDPGPDYADNLSACNIILDQHNHSPGSGQQIQPNGLNISSDLTFQSNNATNLKSARFTAQSVPITNSGANVGCIYVSGNELYYNDVTGGNQVKITTNGSVNSGAGSITGLPSGTASASFAAGTFTWQSATNTSATMDAGSYILRNNTANSKGLTLNPPNAMGADYSLTLPTVPPSNTSIMQMDTSGNMSAVLTVDGTTITIVGNQLVATTQLTAANQTEVNTGTNTTKFVNPATLVGRTNVAIFNAAGTYTWTAPAGCNYVTVLGRGGAGGGGSGTAKTVSSGACGGAGGGGAVSIAYPVAVTPGTQYTIIVGAGGAGGAAQTNNNSNGNNGSNGAASSFGGISFSNIGLGGSGGVIGSSSTGGSTQFGTFAGSGGGAVAGGSASAGSNSIHGTGGSAGTSAGAGSSGGGGGGAGDANGAAGSNSSSPGTAGGDGGLGGGGGGSCGTNGNSSGRGGNGNDGQIVLVYENVYIANTNT